MPGITLLGLGPGDTAKLTREAWEVLVSADQVWLRTKQHSMIYMKMAVRLRMCILPLWKKFWNLENHLRVWSMPSRVTRSWLRRPAQR